MRHFSAAELRSLVQVPASQDRLEVRWFSIVVTLLLQGELARSAVVVLCSPQTPLYRVADLARVGRVGVAVAFVVCALLLLPHLVRLVFNPSHLSAVGPRRWATWGAVGATIAWGYLAALSDPLDLDVWWIYAGKALGTALVALLYAQSINAQQLRELLKNEISARG